MSEVVLSIIVLSLLGFHLWYVHQTNKERADWMKALMSKTLPEFTQAKLDEQPKKDIPTPEQFDELSHADPNVFDQMIQQTIAKQGEAE